MTQLQFRYGDHRLAGYRSGEGGIPLLVVHGGPGVPTSYLYEAHKQYAQEGFDVVSWDQLGCGKSARPTDKSLWQVPRYVDEVEAVRAQLGWDKFILMGNSWGGILGLEYCLAHMDRVAAFVMSSIGASMPLLNRGFERCKAALGTDTVRMMALREYEGTTSHPEYDAARTLLMYRHMCRMDKWPEPVLAAMAPEAIGQGPFTEMFGPHFFNCTGNLANWDRMADVHRIKIPMQVVAGEWDYVLPEYMHLVHDHVASSEMLIVRNAGHMPFWDQPQPYHSGVLDFLKRQAGHFKRR